MSDERERNVPFIVVGVILLVVSTGSILTSMGGIGGMRKDPQFVIVPGEVTLSLREAGTYTIFHEYKSMVEGVRYSGSRLPSELTIESAESGDAVSIATIGGYSNYSMGDHSGESAYRFIIDTAGDYIINAHYSGDESAGQTVLSIVHWHMDFVRLGLGMLIFSVCLGLGIMFIKKGSAGGSRPAAGELTQGKYVYENNVTYSGDPKAALNQAHAVFTAAGFSNIETSGGTMDVVGPGMNSNRQPPLLGATIIRIETKNSRISIHAELGGVRRMRNFLLFFPPGLAVFLGLTMSPMLMNDPDTSMGFVLLPLLVALPWLFIGPVIIRSLRQKTVTAIDLLIEGMASAA